MTGLEPDRLLALLIEDLTPWMAEWKGQLTVASDPWNFLELLSEKPTGWRGVLHWEGDDNLMEHPANGCFVANRFSFGVTCQKGLTLRPEERLYKKAADGTPALLRLVALARARIRSFAWPADVSERACLYKGCDPLILPDGTPLMGYRLRFTLTAHPQAVDTLRNV